MDGNEIKSFFHRILENKQQRLYILSKWVALRCVGKVENTRVFKDFISAILYEPIEFHLLWDRFHLFGDLLPVRYEWLSNVDRECIIKMFTFKETVFKSRKEYENNQIDYSCTNFDEKNIVKIHWRRRLVRDFVCLVWNLSNDAIILDLIVALQNILKDRNSDLFISLLNQSLQGRCCVYEVPCWGLAPWEKGENI